MIPYLVQTLEKTVGEIIAKDFWANHHKHQDDLDRQNEGELSFVANVHRQWDLAMQREPFWSRIKKAVNK